MKKQINLTILSLICLLLLAGCGGGQAGAGPTAATVATPVVSNAGATAQPEATMPPSTSGADLTNFDPCSVVNDDEYKNALNADTVAAGGTADETITVSHEVITNTNDVGGLPGSKACRQARSPIGPAQYILFLPYDKLSLYKAGSHPLTGFEAAGGDAFAQNASTYMNKSGYLFTVGGMGGSESAEIIKLVMIGIANRLPSH